MAEKKILLDVDVNISQAIKKIAEYEQKIEQVKQAEQELKAQIKEQGTATQEQREQLVRLKAERIQYSKEVTNQTRMLNNQMTATSDLYANTLQGLRSQLSAEKDKLRYLQLGTDEYARQSAVVDDLNDKVKAHEYAYGVYVRNVGNYGNAINSLKGEARGLYDTLKSLQEQGKVSDSIASKLAGEANDLSKKIEEIEYAIVKAGGTQTEEGQKLNGELTTLKGQLGEIQGELGKLGEGESVKGLSKDIKDLTSASLLMFTAVAGGDKVSEEYKSTLQAVQKAMMALIIVQKLSTTASKNSTIARVAENLAQKVGIVQSERQAKAQLALVAMKKADTLATKGLAVAQWLWNTALSANPIFLLITAIGAVVAGVVALTSAFSSNASELKRLNDEVERYDRLLEDNARKADELALKSSLNSLKITQQYAKEIEDLQKSGATAEQVQAKKVELEKALNDEQEQHLKEEQKRIVQRMELLHRELYAQEQVLALTDKGTDEWRERSDAIDQTKEKLIQLEQELTNIATQQANNRIKKVEEEYQKRSGGADTAYERERKRLDSLQSVEKASFNARKKYRYDYTLSVEENAKKQADFERQMSLQTIEFEQRQRKAQLELQRKYNKISQDEYKAQLDVLKIEYNAFIAEMQDSQIREAQQLIDNAITLAGGKVFDKQLADIEKKYYDATKVIERNDKLSADEKDYYIRKLKEKEIEDINNLEIKSEEERAKKVENIVSEMYKNDVRAFSQSEFEKQQLAVERLQALIAERKKAGLSTQEEQAELAVAQLALRKAELDRDVALNWANKEKKFEIQKEYYEGLLAMENLSAEQRAEAEQNLTNLVKEHNLERLQSFENWKDRAFEIANAFSELTATLGEARIQKYQEETDEKKKALDKQLKAGLISQKQHDKEVAKLDEELAKKELKIKREQAIQEKIINVTQTAMNTATTIMKTGANLGYPAAIPFIAMASAMGALQIATILAQPLPKAREGLIVGESHERGGVIINAEGGERIIAKEPTKAFPELLNLISYIGKHAGVPDTGYAGRQMLAESGMNTQSLADAIGNVIADRLREMNISVSVEEIERAEAIKTQVINSAKL